MKASFALLAFGAHAVAVQANPLAKVLELIDELRAKVVKDGEVEAAAFKEYTEWADDTAKNGHFAVEDATKQKAKLEAEIAKLTGDIQTNDQRITDLAASISQADGELNDATLIRDKEQKEFAASEGELVSSLEVLERAVGILSKEMAKNPALMQVDTSNIANMLQAMSAILDASAFPSRDQKALAAFVQSQQQQQQSDEDSDPGAPAAAAYKSQSSGIVDVLEDMKEKAETELSDLRKAEQNSRHNFEMLKQSLEDQLKADNHDLEEEKAAKSANQEGIAVAEGDLAVTTKTLADSQQQLATAQSTCMQVAADHEGTMASRSEEIGAIDQAKKILEETSAAAVSQSYSFVQVSSRMRSRADLRRSEVVTMVKQLAKRHHSAALAQLASKIAAVEKFGSLGGEDPFGKIKSMVSEMIAKLEKEAADETSEKAYCDEQTSKTEAKKAELEDEVAKLTAKIDKAVARSAELKEQVKVLESELGALAKEQAEMDMARSEENAAFKQAKADLDFGLSGVRQALGVLREYYQGGAAEAALLQDESKFGSFMQQPAMPEKHNKSGGAGGSILSILEVVESDFAKNLAKEETEEEDAATSYEKLTQENKVTKTTKEQDVQYKTDESTSLDQAISETSADRETTNTELAAVNEYYATVNDRCIAKPETYEDRKAAREAEITGLKQALTVLNDETAFVQRKRRSFRGSALVAR